MPFRVTRSVAVVPLLLVMSCGARVSLGDDDESATDASATESFDSASAPPIDASVGDEPEATDAAAFEDASIDVDEPDGDAALD